VGVIKPLAGKRDALMPPNSEELLNRPQYIDSRSAECKSGASDGV